MSTRTPEQVLKSIVDGINTGNLEALMSLYEPAAAFASQPGSLKSRLTDMQKQKGVRNRKGSATKRGQTPYLKLI